MDEDERRRKVEAGRAKKSSTMPRSQNLASFRQKRAKSDGAGAAKKTQKRKGQVDSQNDRSTEDHHVEPALPSASATEYNNSTNHEEPQMSGKPEVRQNEAKDQPLTPKHSPSPVDDLREEELAALTGKEQLKLLQQAVEKRNEIIAKLSSNLQEALASRDQVQVEAQSLAGQLQALQRQLQQTSVEFLRIKNLSGTEALNIQQPYHEPSSQEPNISHKEAPSEGSGSSGSQSDAEGETDVETVLCKLRAELEEERRNSQRICSELAEEMEKNKHVLSLLENEKQEGEEERKEREAELQNLHFQLSQLQSQCLEMQQYKEEKEVLNIELQELRRRLQEEEDAGKSYSEKLASSALCFQSLEEEMKRLKEEHTVEVEQVRQLLEEREKELKMKEEEVVGFKASKNWQNQVKAGVSSDETVSIDEANLESGADQGSMNESMSGNLLMERYLSSAPLAHLQYSAITENLDQCSQLDISADRSFELNSDVFGEELLSISKRLIEEHDDRQNASSPQDSLADESNPQWLHNVASGRMERSNVSEQQSEDTNLEKELLSQQCEELREELALKERDLNVLKEEVIKSAEELEEARSRWAQVTEELREALQELEDEKEMRRQFEEELNLKVYEQDSLRSKHCALSEEREQENVVMLTVKETEISAETSLLISGTFPSDEDEKLVGELKEEETALQSHQKQQELLVSSLQEIKQTADLESTEFRDDNQLQTLQANYEHLMSQLEETKTEHETASTLLSQRTTELDTVLKELQTTRVQILSVQTEVERLEKELQQSLDSLHCAEKEKHELESQISCLREKLTCSEEDRAQAVKERDEHSRREEEMDEQIKKMEQVLEEELEQFEKLLKAKDVELAEVKEKWEEERMEKDKEIFDVRHLLEEQMKEKVDEVKALLEKQAQAVEEATEKLKASHQQEIKDLMEKHQQEISDLNTRLETELLKQRASMEEEQKQQISLIKQVTEREHERMISELSAKHNEVVSQLKTEVSLELRESMEAAHQAELQQVQAQKAIELESLRLSLTTVHKSHLERSQENVEQEQTSALIKVQASMQEKFDQEIALLQARHQSEVDQIKRKNQEQQERLLELHQQDMEEMKEQWETRVAQERASMDEKQAKEIQDLRAQWEKDAEAMEANFQTSLLEIQNSLSATQTELTSTQASLAEAQEAVSQKQLEVQETQASIEELQTSSKEQTQKLEELKRALAERDAAVCSLEEEISSNKTLLQKKEQQVLHLQEKEQQLQQEVSQLQQEKNLLKQSSDQEISQLWTQLESMRTSRQELGELKEQLLARSSRVDDIERLKMEFNEQKREIKEQNEAELENLRRYFEKRLHATEESHKEEIALLQLKLVEGALEDSLLKMTDDGALSQCQAQGDKDVLSYTVQLEKQREMLDSLTLHLEAKHTMDLSNLRSSLTLSFEEEVQKVRADLTDHYYKELQEMKTRHALDLEQLRAKLSDRHLQELTRVHLEAAMQVEAEVEHRIWSHTEELQTATTIIYTLENRVAALTEQHDAEIQNMQKMKQEFAEQLARLEEALELERSEAQENMNKLKEELQEKYESEISVLRSHHDEMATEQARLEKALHEEKEKLKSLQDALENDESQQVLLLKQKVEANDAELQKTKDCMSVEFKELLHEQVEMQLCQARERFQEEKAAVEQRLIEKYEVSVAELKDKYEAELEHERATLLNTHSKEMDALNAKHKAELDSLSASHKDQLSAKTAEFECKHNAERVALEVSLGSKLKEDLERLEETNRAKLEALEAELTLKHQEEKDELEKRMLSNMDTLEATYLKEVQTLRDEMAQLEEKHREDLIFLNSEHKQVIERHTAEQLSIREELRKELAHVHMEKFKAMAAELSHVHKSQLAAQKESLDTEHCKALEALKNQVLELEQQHSTALQELSQTYTAEKGQLTKQHQVQLQELKGVSARELEACRRELEEESSRQRQHFLEEVELLKVQSEERLQDRINQLKTEFEEQKEAELENLRRSFTSEQEEKEQSYTEKMSQLTAQLQQLDAVVAQLRAEVGCLQGELEGKRAEMETMDTLLQRRERETQEGGNLLKMLTDDLQTAKEERCKLHRTNEKLRQVLIEMLRGIVATEELIGQKISARAKTSEQATHQRSSSVNKEAQESGISVADLSSEELELTQLLCESLLVSDGEISPGGEEAALSACSRLRHTVDTLLELLNQANTQLEQTHSVHLSLEEKFSQGREDSAQLLEQHKRLMEQLDQEAKLKSQLQVELHKAEGLLEGYMAEKAALEESLQQKETQEERLVEELEDLKVKLHQMEGLTAELDTLRVKHHELTEEHAILLRHKEHLSAGLGEREKGHWLNLDPDAALLAETDRLSQDRLDLQRQAEKDHRSLSLRLRTLERELEEQETRGLETELHHKTHTEDLNQRVQALEKQLKHDRQFIEEQAVEREHERDEFQQEIRRLEAQLRQTPSVDNKGYQFEDLVLQVESLQGVIKDKTEDYSSLLGTCQQAQCDLAERNEEIDKLAGRIRELEQALLNSVESNRCVGQLEQELQKAKLREQELTQDKQALEQQQLSSRLQISALQSKLDETRHCYHDNMRDPTQELKDALDTAQQSLQSKEQEVEVLLGQLETVQRDLNIKEAEVKHLTLQLELLTNSNAAHVNELQEQITALKENVSALTILKEEKEQLCKEDEMDEETLPSALLQEKNHEIDHLNSEIQRLEQELENTSDNKVLEAELEDLRSQVEHLKSEITRVRQDKQEEEERLHEVISTLQAELATLGPNLHEVSDSQDGDSINPSPAPSPEPQNDTIQEQEKKAGPNSLKHELSLTHSTASRSLRSRIKALQSQLETAVAEKEGLERLLLTQEEEYRGYGEEFGKRLKAEREKSDEIQSLLSLKETELEEVTAQLEEEREERKGWKVQAEEAGTLQEEKARLSSQVLELQTNEEERVREIKTLKTKETEMEMEMGILRESSLTLERQVQELRAEVVDMEEQVAQERARIKTLETVKGELSAEREALRRREGQLQEEIEKLQQEVTSLRALIQDLTVKLNENETSQEEAQKEVLTHAEETLAKADTALRQKEVELSKLKEEHQALRTELTALRQGLSTSTERAEKLHEEVQTKDRALIDLEADNQQLKAELQSVQEDLAAQEEELAYQQRELQQLRQQSQQDTLQGYPHKDISVGAFEDIVSHHEDSLSSPEVLRRLECSEDRILERFHTSELSGLNNTGLDLPQVKPSPRVVMEPPSHSRTITPDPATQSSHSPRSVSVSENYSILDSLDADKVRELEGLDLTTPSSPLGSTSSLSAPEWASDGYGSNVSSELGARLRLELEQTERLDAQFIEYLRCRGVDPTANTDSAAGSMSYSDDLLSPELQGLLKKVYQESCRILTLSQRRVNPSAQSHVLDLKACSLSLSQHHAEDGSAVLHHQDKSSNPPMSWQQEKRALQETVIALRELLCRMAQRHSQTDDRVDSNWHRDQLQTERRDESQLRAELEESQKQLKCAHDAQQEQKNKTMSLRLTIEEAEEALRREQARVCELQQELEQERALSLRKGREEEERRENVQVSSEKLRSEVMSLKGQVEQERVACSNLRQELQIEQSRCLLLEKRLEDTQKELEDERKRSSHQQELSLQEKTRQELLLTEAETRLTEIHSKLADSHRKLDEEQDRCSRQVDELSRRHDADAARDRKFISDLRSQLEQERRQGEELAAVADRLRAELLQSRRRWEEEDRTRREELQKEQEAATRNRITIETLKEQKQEANQALEVEREQSRRQEVELAELKERLRMLKDKEREREEQWEREKRKEMQEQMERERRQERINSKLCELELLRQQDQQRMQELQRTLAELERDEREMAAQRLSGQTAGQQREAEPFQHPHTNLHTDGGQAGVLKQHQQTPSKSSSNLLETLLKENSELTERVTSLSQERATLKHKLTCLERQLRRTENELAKVTAETENRPVYDISSQSKLQRYYERYLRAESFRKALVYQKRYLLLLIGGFQECEQATLCLIAHMGARPSPPVSSKRRPLGRFRAAVQVIIAVSRMRFLTRKWQKAIRRLSTGVVNGHAPGPKAEVLRQQQPRSNSDPTQIRDSSAIYIDTLSALVPPSKSPFRLRHRSHSSTPLASVQSGGTAQDPEQSLTEYIRHLEKVQQRLVGAKQGSSGLLPDPK
ncbi:pericentrin isoform X4 [Haplochromis burtoni]|uniref:pericentrin isoform X4 n=1 Tax=Haplochromis burtoni TaxID=8153 RepID=UPI001C2D1D22|nr:pericentrin isoform X4 [Haplochromis burtoni]